MTKRFARWLGNTAVSLGLLASAFVTQAAGATDPTQGGQDSANSALSQWGSQGGIQNNFANPLTGGAQMTTLDGTKSFNGKVSCPSTNNFLSITILPSPTGDLSTVQVRQDTNMDGTTDYTYWAPFLVSGVCADGLIACDPGSWNNCKYYKWVADATSYKASLSQVNAITSLSGCYCINNSCGTNLATVQRNVILKDIGMGVAAALQGNNPQFTISKVDMPDSFTISFYGQQAANCSSASTGMSTGSSNPTQYYDNPGAMTGDAQTQMTNQLSDPNSYYYALNSASNNVHNQGTTKQCTIQDVALPATLKQSPTYNWLPWLDMTMHVWYGRDGVNATQYTVQVDLNSDGAYDRTDTCSQSGCSGLPFYEYTGVWSGGTVPPGSPDQWATYFYGILDDVASQYEAYYSIMATNVRTSSTCNTQGGWYNASQKGWTADESWLNDYCKEKISPPVCPAGFTLRQADTMCYKENLSDSVVNNCSQLETDPTCSLQSETVDGVSTYSNFNPTMLTPLPSCKTITGVLQNYNVCHSWWTKTRNYYCTSGSGYDFSDAQKRTTAIYGSVKDNTTTLTYNDKTKDANGNWTISNNSITLPDRAVTECQKACKVKTPTTNTQATYSGNVAQQQVSNASFNFTYKQCANGACPTSSGDIIVTDCSCVGDFPEAATVMSVLNNAGKDLICSSGTPH